MTLDNAVKDLADELLRQEFVEILCHHDADGIAAGSIMGIALFRAGIPFRLRITHRLSDNNYPKSHRLLLCDLGSGSDNLPEETMIIDHHIPFFEGPFHVNPRLEGIDGDTDLSSAGASYLVANHLGDNRDLSGLFLPGVIGDGQTLSGKNLEIYHEALANDMIQKKRGLKLPGRTLKEQIMLATEPFVPGVSGSEEETNKLINLSETVGNDPNDILCSLLVIASSKVCRPDVILNLWGDKWHLEREVIEDAFSMTYVIDSCGKSGSGSLAASLCLRSSNDIDLAYDLAQNHRMMLIEEMSRFLASPGTESIQFFMSNNLQVTSDLADTIQRNIPGDLPVLVTSQRKEGTCSCSVRAPLKSGKMLGEIVQKLAEECGGNGGGHQRRAGAVINCDRIKHFAAGIIEECAV